MQLASDTTARAWALWAGWARHAAAPDFVSVVRIGTERFVAAPPTLRARVESADPVTVDDLVDVVGRNEIVRCGEARLAYTDRTTFRPQSSTRVTQIPDDDGRLAVLQRASDVAEWNESMSHDAWVHRTGIADDRTLAAVAAYEVWDESIAHVAVFTAAVARSRGLSTEVASAAVEHALASGYVPQWRVRSGNDASWRVAQKLGFIEAGGQIFAAVQRDG